MFDSFPFDKWSEDVAEFWTWGGGGSTGTWIMTALGFGFMLLAFYGFVRLENQKLMHQRDALRALGGLRPPATTGGGMSSGGAVQSPTE